MLTAAETQVRERAAASKLRAAGGLRSLSEELSSLADGTSPGRPSKLTDLTRGASVKIKNVATWLDTHEPARLLGDLRAFARRKPGGFRLGASAASAMAARLSGSSTGAGREGGALTTSPTAPAALPAPPASPGLRVSPSLSADRDTPDAEGAEAASPLPASEPSQASTLRGDLA